MRRARDVVDPRLMIMIGTDPREENEQDGSERSDTGGTAATTAGVVRVRNKQVQPGSLRAFFSLEFNVWDMRPKILDE